MLFSRSRRCSGPANMAESVKKITLEEVQKHNAAGSSWLVIHNRVFDVTKFLDEVRKGFNSTTAGKDSIRRFAM